MNTPSFYSLRPGLVLIWLFSNCLPTDASNVVYKCVEGGRTSFSAAPSGDSANCHPVELNVIQPNPVDVARQKERQRLSMEEDKMEEARAREEKRERDIERRLERAATADDAMRLLRQYPSFGGGRHRRGWSRGYQHYGPNSSERLVFTPPEERSRPDPSTPVRIYQKP